MDVATRGAGGSSGAAASGVNATWGVSAIVEYDYAAKEPDELDLIKGALIHSIKQMPGGWWEGTLQSNGKTGMFPDNFVRVIDTSDESKVTMRDKATTSNRRCKVIFSYTQVNDDELSLAVGDVIEVLGEVEEGWWRGRLKSKVGVFPSNFVTAIEPSPILASKRPPTSAYNTATGNETKAPTTATTTTTANNSATVGSSATAANAAAASSNSSSTTTTTKKMNRLSYHSSKEDLLSSTDDVAPSLPPKPQREYCRVEYPYAPQNDDELELKTGEIITIISMELPDKGWWKGELHGKVGVFPDNFVKLLAPSEVSPLNESSPQQSNRTAKTTHATATTNSSHSAQVTTTATSSKAFVKKSGSSSSTHSGSNRKDSFGSRDSLSDILSETGLQSGNVAAQRKSLENKNLDLTNAPDASTRLGLKKQQLHQQQQQQHMQETKSILTNNSNITVTTVTSSSSSVASSSSAMSSNAAAVTNELRKSLENLDEKNKPPPPVLTKKPVVPSKKTPSSVASNFFSGFSKPKSKNPESKLTTAASHDYADGVGSSKLSSGVASDTPSNVVMRRAATIAVEDSDFDRVERASMLPDMRAGRVKAPKRRPPSAAINVIGESNNNNSIYLNGSGGGVSLSSDLPDDAKPQSSDDNSTGEEQLAKPKPREWEKKKAPWMDELKASQVKKKTSPSVEPRTTGGSTATERTKSLGDETKINNNSSNQFSASSNTVSTTSSSTSASSSTTTKLQSSSISSSIMQQSMIMESNHQLAKKELIWGSSSNNDMAKSMNSKFSTTTTETVSSAAPAAAEDIRLRPNSLSINNQNTPSALRSASDAARSLKSSASPAHATTSTAPTVTEATSSSTNSHAHTVISAGTTVNNHHAVEKTSTSNSSDSLRVVDLERRVGKLEATVHAQQRTIDELVRLLREETDRVKVLRGELDKYAQCVTQV